MTVALMWAQSADGWIGRDGGLPWHLPEDLARFRRLTSGAPVVMGRTTWDSLPERYRPLPDRHNIVLSRDPARRLPGATVVDGVQAALAAAAVPGARSQGRGGPGTQTAGGTVWVIGGAQVYRAFWPGADRLEITDVDLEVSGDTAAPAVDDAWRPVAIEPAAGWATSATGLRYRFRTLVRTRPDAGAPGAADHADAADDDAER